MTTVSILDDNPLAAVLAERARQDAKWGEQNHDDLAWLAILMEEVGEAAECVCKTSIGPTAIEKPELHPAILESEVIHVAAVAVAWVEAMRRRGSAG